MPPGSWIKFSFLEAAGKLSKIVFWKPPGSWIKFFFLEAAGKLSKIVFWKPPGSWVKLFFWKPPGKCVLPVWRLSLYQTAALQFSNIFRPQFLHWFRPWTWPGPEPRLCADASGKLLAHDAREMFQVKITANQDSLALILTLNLTKASGEMNWTSASALWRGSCPGQVQGQNQCKRKRRVEIT